MQWASRPEWGKLGLIGFSDKGMPDKYFPAGWFAFVLFGPMPITGIALACLTEDGKNVEKMSRKDARKLEAEAKTKGRQAGAGGLTTYARGHSVNDQANIAFLAQQELANERRNIINLLHEANSDHTATLAELKEVRNMTKDLKEDNDDEELLADLVKTRRILVTSLVELNTRKKNLQEAGRKLMVADPKRQVAGCFPPSDSVSCNNNGEAFSEVTAATSTAESRKRSAEGEPKMKSKLSAQVLNYHMKFHSQPPCNQEALPVDDDDNNESNYDNQDEGMDPKDARAEGRGTHDQLKNNIVQVPIASVTVISISRSN